MKHGARIVFFIVTLALLPGVCHAQKDNPLVHEGIVTAPLDQVWAALTTKAGLESWMTAHAEIELKLGGKMRTQYDPKGTVDDATAIENTILSYESMRMLSFRVTKAPQGFPFPNAIKNMWTVIYFEATGAGATRVREVSMGFGDDAESKKMREFFERGNAYTLKKLQEHFTTTANAQSQDLVLVGTITKTYPRDAGRSLKRWAVVARIDTVVSGDLSGKTFTFTVHSPARSGLEVGRAYTIRATRTADGYIVDELQWMR